MRLDKNGKCAILLFMTQDKLFHDKVWLTEARKTRTLQDIGDEFGVSREAIRLWCSKFDIPKLDLSQRWADSLPDGFDTLEAYVADRLCKGWYGPQMVAETRYPKGLIRRATRASQIDARAVRFHLLVAAPTDDCWEWRGARDQNGYGHVTWHGKHTYAHRIAWELAYGPIPEGLCVCHHCDNPGCCNPTHLFMGTKKDNSQDMVRKGRSNTKLTAEQALEVRRLYAAGGVTYAVLGERFGVSLATIGAIVRYKTWKYL